jgi:DNA-directed RNA polymerase specialized sigma subunit
VRTHLLSQLQSLRRLSAQQQNIISIPEQVGLDYTRFNESENELRDRLGRDPTDDETADATGLSTRRIQKIRAFNQPVSEGMTTREVMDEESYGGDVASTIPNNTRAANAWFNFVYEDLSPVDKLIADMTLGRNGRRQTSTQEIARRLNITPGAVSQRAAKIQAMLDKQYTQSTF